MCEGEIITNEDVTNKDVLEFYADKGTGELIKKCRLQPSGAYKKLAKTFNLPNKEVKKEDTEDEKENKKFYNWLKEQEKQNFVNMKSLKKVAEDKSFREFILKPELKDPLIEKWHLYVSFYALEEYWGKKEIETVPWRDKSVKDQQLTTGTLGDPATKSAGILNGSNNRCFRLLLWMYEASEPDKDDLYEKVKKAVCNGSLKGLTGCLRKNIKDNIIEWKKRTKQDN